MAKFLSYEDRLMIESYLKENKTFTEIGKALGRDRTTIAKEVKIMLLSSAQDTVHILIMFVNIGKHVGGRRFAVQMSVNIR